MTIFLASLKLKFGFDGHLYCDCGSARVSDFRFRCSAGPSVHGSAHRPFATPTDLEEACSGLRCYEGVNLLLVGPDGSGRATFVNAFANYTAFDSLVRQVLY